ncbi:hypothetical protein V8C35DRAFT_288281 [Trichoderma chlorosporum]
MAHDSEAEFPDDGLHDFLWGLLLLADRKDASAWHAARWLLEAWPWNLINGTSISSKWNKKKECPVNSFLKTFGSSSRGYDSIHKTQSFRTLRLAIMAVVSSPPKPHIVIIPGAWHPGSTMDMFIKSLEAAGFSAEAISLRSVGTAGISVQDDEAQVKALLTPLLEEGRDVLVVAHSYGGVVAAGVVASSNVDFKSRAAQGFKGGVVGIVYLAALMPLQDETIFGLSGGKWAENINADKAETEGTISLFSGTDYLFNDCSNDIASSVMATLKPHSVEAMKTAPSAIGWQSKAYDGRRAYIRALKDNALPIKVQDHLIARSGVEWMMKTLDSSHSPFLSMPDELTRVLQEIVDEFAKC